jgi:hypothetical protein
MPSKLPDYMKSLVIQQWLRGESRDKIAGDNGLSAGSVTNIINEWRSDLNFAMADALRDLALTLKRIGITPAQCATGFRVAMMMNRLEVKEDDYESFMRDVYNRCKNVGLTPESIVSYLTDLLEFSKTMPFSQIPDFIHQKKDEKEKLEQEIKNLKNQIVVLKFEKSDCETLRDGALEDVKITKSQLKWYSEVKEELRKYGMAVDDISKLVNLANGIRQLGYDANTILNQYSNLESVGNEYNRYYLLLADLKRRYNILNQEYFSLQETVNSWNQSISECSKLYEMGFGFKELKLLRYTITEIGLANNIDPYEAAQKFFKDLNEHYDDKLGFESKQETLQAEVNRLLEEGGRLRMESLMLPLVGPSLTKLVQRGVSEQNIVDIAELLKNDSSNTGKKGSSSSSLITIEEIRSLIAERRKCDSIESTISQLSQKEDKLRNQVASLRAEKHDLYMQNQKMFSTLLYSRQLVDFFSGSSASLRNEITGLVSIFAFMLYLLNLQIERLEESQDKYLNEFVPLIRAARGGVVSLPELKSAMTKAIELLLEKLNSDDDNDNNNKINMILSEARTALLNNNSKN